MQENILKRLVEIRHELHQHPQISMKQFQTTERIRQILMQFGVKEDSIKRYDPTGLTADLIGEAQPKGKDYCVAFRADIDALSMTEENTQLQYVSKNKGSAHMCGHDGHMTCLLGFVPLFFENIKTFPSNKKVRLIFQPSEQGPLSGAEMMIKQGCLEGVDEVYGFHNWPIKPYGQVWCKQGPVMSEITIVEIKIIGTGGHGSQPQTLKVAIWKAIDFYKQIQSFLEDLSKQKPGLFVCTLPVFQTGQRYNVIAQSVKIEGTIRSFEQKVIREIIINKIKELLDKIKEEGFDYEFNVHRSVITSNTKSESDNVLRVAAEVVGKQNVGQGILPFKASEDFGYFTMHRPGAYYFWTTGKQQSQPFLHNPRFNFDDELISKAAVLWLKLAQDRLNSQ